MRCPICGKEYSALGHHFSRGSCDYPKLSNREKEIISGCLLGDGQIFSGRKNAKPSFRISSTQPLFLNWLYQEMDYLSSSIEVQFSKKELDEKQKGDNKQVWRYRTISNPYLSEFEDWYSENGKSLPNNFSLTPLKAKMWYCGDGSLRHHKGYGYGSARIYSNNENLMEVLLEELLELGFSPSLRERDYGSEYCDANYLEFTTEETKDFLEWMGKAPPGFEYKWDYRRNI